MSSTSSVFSYLGNALEANEDSVISVNASSYADQELYKNRLKRKSGLNWYVKFRSEAILYILLIATLLEFLGYGKLHETSFTKELYPYLLVFFCLTLLTYYLGSIGRFKNIFYLISLSRYAIIFPKNHNLSFMKALVLILLPTLIVYTTVTFRSELYYVESYTPVASSITIFFARSSESLSEFIVGH